MIRIILTCVVLTLAAGRGGAQTPPAPECPEYADRLESCSPYTCTFTHPLTGAPMERRIAGLQGELCAYVEQMPNGGSMECSYTPAMRREMAAFVRMTQAAESMEGRARISSQGSTTTTTVDGQPVKNPLDEALRSGACKIGGYGSGRPAAPPAPPTPSVRDAVPVMGAASGTMTLGGKQFQLSHAYAFAAPGGAKGSVLIVLADAPLSAEQAQRPELERRMRGSRLHAVSAVVDLSNNTVTDMHVFDPAHQYAVFVAPSNRRLVVVSSSEEAVAGQLSTIRAGAFAGVPYEVAAAFSAGVQR